MSIISFQFIAVYVLLLFVYWLVPQKAKNWVLLLFCWGFMVSQDWKYFLFLVAVTIISYAGGYVISQYENQGKAFASLITSILILLGMLVVVKYTPFPIQVVGISFFTFQAVSYVIDVYRNDTKCEKNFMIFALYIAFFPQLMCGPIAKSKEQISRYKDDKILELTDLEKGLVMAAYGLFLKLVIADRIGIFVDGVYSDVSAVGGLSLIAVILLYSVQIYGDFAGYSLIAIGIGRTFGITLPENFKAPYLSKSINEFWKRWHISLTSWFRDYLYFPLGGNQKGEIRTYVNVLTVFVVSGIWHGAGLTYIVWGLLHGILQVIEKAFVKIKNGSRIVTYILVSIFWVFFRANTLGQAAAILGGVINNSNGYYLSNILSFGLDKYDFLCLAVAIAVMIAVDILIYKNKNLVNAIFRAKLPIRWVVLASLLLTVLVFGVYGPGYDASNFIYLKF